MENLIKKAVPKETPLRFVEFFNLGLHDKLLA